MELIEGEKKNPFEFKNVVEIWRLYRWNAKLVGELPLGVCMVQIGTTFA